MIRTIRQPPIVTPLASRVGRVFEAHHQMPSLSPYFGGPRRLGPPYGTESFLFLVTVNRADSDPWMTQLVLCRETRAPVIVWAPVLRVLPRICTMLGGKSGKELPSKATPTPSNGTRTTKCVRCTEV